MSKKLLRNCKLAFTDTETTGLDYKENEIISIALVVRTPSKNVLHRRVWYMHPRWPEKAHPKALEINGYTESAWNEKGVVSYETAFKEYHDLTLGCLFVAHNTFFDKIMIMEEYNRQGLTWNMDYHSLDTSSLAWYDHCEALAKGIGLKDVCDHYEISNSGSHDALVDVDRTIQAYDFMMLRSLDGDMDD